MTPMQQPPWRSARYAAAKSTAPAGACGAGCGANNRRIITMTLRICNECGASLDPGERCDCQKEQDGMEVEGKAKENPDV